MSNLLFPKTRGLAWDVEITPVFSTEIQEAISGREVRIQNYPTPKYKFTFHYEFLRNTNDPKLINESGYTDLETIMGFFDARAGQFDDFLLNVSDLTQRPEDSIYSGQPLGVGDGTTTAFQVTRNFGSSIEAVQNPTGLIVYSGGAVVAPANYTLSAKGKVVFTVAPLLNVVLSCDFVMLHRVRFNVDELPFNDMMYLLFECQSLALITAKV